ncbi:MAG TPA: DNA polymerase I [Parafilimonas sp.]|nr:DNA polymerase I [Parafilimonas sp.]
MSNPQSATGNTKSDYLSTMDKRLFLLDAYALIFRAYYALIRNPRFTSKGRNTNAQFGFTNTLMDLINKERPTHLAVCFDVEGRTERHSDFAEYKANRQETPEDLLEAIPDIKRILEGFNIPCMGLEGYEADDVIGTLAWQANDAGYEVYMVTPDKDFGQLVRDGIKIYKPGYQGGIAEILGPKEVCAKWDIERVDQVIDILSLMGDSIDNIPGIPGIGEKTASKLLKEHGSLENILANAENIKGALGEKIKKGKESAVLSKKLATIVTNVPVQFHEENFCLKEWNKPALIEVFTELEFKSLGKRVLGDEFNVFQSAPVGVQTDMFAPPVANGKPKIQATEDEAEVEALGLSASKNINNTEHNYLLVDTHEKIRALVGTLMQQTEICFDTETTGNDANDAELLGLSFSYKPGEAYFVTCTTDYADTCNLLSLLDPVFENPALTWVGHNIKYDLLVLKWYNREIKGQVYDTMLVQYVIEPDMKRPIDQLSAQYLGYEPIAIEEMIGKGRAQTSMRSVEIEKIKDYSAEDVDITLQLKHALHPLLKTKDVERVFYEVENPLVKVLTDMEYEGVMVDVAFLANYSKELEREAYQAEQAVFAGAGVKFLLSSPKQLGEVLFEKLKLNPVAKKTKSGQYATGEDVLLKLAQSNPIVEDILIYRELTKLKSTYVDALPLLINKKTGRVHTTFAQAVAVTGRLSSNNPNLQNIPIRTERGKEIRKAFIPRDGNVIISADYSQIELRIVAGISGDENMCAAFKSNIDIHTATAAKVYGIAPEEVTKVQRYKAKSVNFGIIYGQGAFGLADNLGISRAEAKQIIDNYKKEFSGIARYMDNTINFCREHGYVQTLIGRKRWLKDINSSNFTVRSFAERNAINSPIQGTAADMIKMAMIKIHDAMQKEKLKSKMILQVHDELVFDAVKEELDVLQPLILNNMKNAMALPCGVPVEADLGVGDNWLEAH